MKTFIRITQLALCVSLGCGLADASLAQTNDHEQALRELNIMRNIFNASFEDNTNRRFNLDSGEALYLANQGMVFSFDLPGRGWLNMPVLQKLQALDGGDFDFDFDFDFDYDDGELDVFIDGDPDNAQFAEYQQQMRARQEEMREKQQEMREKQRRMREMQREQLRDTAADLDTEIEKLNAELEALGEEVGELGESIGQVQQSYDAERKAQMATIQKAYTTRIFSTLCDYGNTLRSLGSGQHVNIVLNDREENQAQVYVVDYGALASCSSGETLQQSALSYTQPMR